MKTLYFECKMGAAGDMLLSALIELLPDKEGFIERLNSLGIPGVTVELSVLTRGGITGSHVKIMVNGKEEHSVDHHLHEHEHGHAHAHEHDHPHEHHSHEHTSNGDIAAVIDSLEIPDTVKLNAKAVYSIIAKAEAKAHGTEVSLVHFHEVGAMDAVADIVGCCLAIDILRPDVILSSEIELGGGQVRCQHGILPVPAPATANILLGVPTTGGRVQAELCTPTGAALLKRFATGFGNMPPMTVESVGVGCGNKEFEIANCVRAFFGQSECAAPQANEVADTDTVYELTCNLDDMTPEAIGYASELLLESGALDVFTQPVYMKKNRPAVMLTVLSTESSRRSLTRLILEHTTTIGVRERRCGRYIMHREAATVKTGFGEIALKESSGYGIKKVKPEYSSLVSAARENGIAISEVNNAAITAYYSRKGKDGL